MSCLSLLKKEQKNKEKFQLTAVKNADIRVYYGVSFYLIKVFPLSPPQYTFVPKRPEFCESRGKCFLLSIFLKVKFNGQEESFNPLSLPLAALLTYSNMMTFC